MKRIFLPEEPLTRKYLIAALFLTKRIEVIVEEISKIKATDREAMELATREQQVRCFRETNFTKIVTK